MSDMETGQETCKNKTVVMKDWIKAVVVGMRRQVETVRDI
jgi:hypothetical protein